MMSRMKVIITVFIAMSLTVYGIQARKFPDIYKNEQHTESSSLWDISSNIFQNSKLLNVNVEIRSFLLQTQQTLCEWLIISKTNYARVVDVLCDKDVKSPYLGRTPKNAPPPPWPAPPTHHRLGADLDSDDSLLEPDPIKN